MQDACHDLTTLSHCNYTIVDVAPPLTPQTHTHDDIRVNTVVCTCVLCWQCIACVFEARTISCILSQFQARKAWRGLECCYSRRGRMRPRVHTPSIPICDNTQTSTTRTSAFWVILFEGRLLLFLHCCSLSSFHCHSLLCVSRQGVPKNLARGSHLDPYSIYHSRTSLCLTALYGLPVVRAIEHYITGARPRQQVTFQRWNK